MTVWTLGARKAALGSVLALVAGAAAAHSGHDGHGSALTLSWAAGLAHPLGGWDHLLAMLAVGVWGAVSLPGGRRWQAPALFMTALALGAVGAVVLAVPAGAWLELALAGTVVGLGLMLLAPAQVGARAGLAFVALAAMLHGSAHGLEAVGGSAATLAAYGTGFLLASGALHLVGLAAGRTLAAWRAGLPRVLGAALALAGTALLAVQL